MTEWIPARPVTGGRIQAIAGLLVYGEEISSREMLAPAVSALITSAVVGAAFRSLVPAGNAVIGGSACAALSAMVWIAALMMRFDLLAAEEGRDPGASDGFVSGFVQGMSVMGFGGSGAALAALTASGVGGRKAAALASLSSIPVMFLSPADLRSPMALLVSTAALLVWKASALDEKIRPSYLGMVLASLGLLNVRFVPDLYGMAASYQPAIETVVGWVHSYGGPGLILAMIAQSVISPSRPTPS